MCAEPACMCQVCNFRLLGTRDADVCISRRLPALYRIVPQEGAVAEVVIGTNGPFNCAAWLAEWWTEGKSGEQLRATVFVLFYFFLFTGQHTNEMKRELCEILPPLDPEIQAVAGGGHLQRST